jgi:hypothetical protein
MGRIILTELFYLTVGWHEFLIGKTKEQGKCFGFFVLMKAGQKKTLSYKMTGV